MTATPIPRTLTLTAYGDMEVSRLVEKPSGRIPIDTRAVAIERVGEIIQGLKRALNKKKKNLLGLSNNRRIRKTRFRSGRRSI